jgi:adenylate cyclase
MTVALETLATCFQGLLPSQLCTCSSDGIPNVAYVSHVDYVDPTHVALSFQFFNKSRRNIAENPKAFVTLLDPDTGQGWSLRLLYQRSETSGPLFDRMYLRIEAIASYCGLKGIFKLRAADIYHVLAVEPIPETCASPATAAHNATTPLDPVFTVRALQDLASRIQCADSLESLVDSILEGLDESFGFRHSMILLPTEQDGVLVTVATRGYPQNGAGAEVRIGEGIAGLVAEARKPIRIAGLMRGILYAYAMHRAPSDPASPPPGRQIPVPGLENPESQLGVPLLVRGELVGVLCLESDVPYRFHEEDKASIELLGNYLAIAIQNMQWQERASDSAPEVQSKSGAASDRGTDTQNVATPRRTGTDGRVIAFYSADECVFVDGEYLIRGLPARILWRLLTIRENNGREEFSNRELRLDKSLNLPEWKDNLESRLLLLRRRLEQKCPDIRLVPQRRGRFVLQVDSALTLEARD